MVSSACIGSGEINFFSKIWIYNVVADGKNKKEAVHPPSARGTHVHGWKANMLVGIQARKSYDFHHARSCTYPHA